MILPDGKIRNGEIQDILLTVIHTVTVPAGLAAIMSNSGRDCEM